MKKAHVSAAKKETVKQLLQHFQKYSVIGILNIENLPSTQLQAMRRKLRDTVNILIVKRRIILKAIEQNPQLEPLKPYLKRMVGLLFSTENPFTLYKTLKKNKSPA
jgi:ribosomal protein L10